MRLLRKERLRLRRAYLRGEDPLLRTKEFTKAFAPLMPGFVAACVNASPSLQLMLLLPAMPLALAWLGFVIWTIEGVAARQADKHYMDAGRYLLSKEYHG